MDKQFFRIPHLCCDWFWKPACQLLIMQHNSVTPQRAIPECDNPYGTVDSATVTYSHVGGIILESRIMGIFSYSRNVNKNYASLRCTAPGVQGMIEFQTLSSSRGYCPLRMTYFWHSLCHLSEVDCTDFKRCLLMKSSKANIIQSK